MFHNISYANHADRGADRPGVAARETLSGHCRADQDHGGLAHAWSFATITPYTIEEAYEVADAIARDDLDELRRAR